MNWKNKLDSTHIIANYVNVSNNKIKGKSLQNQRDQKLISGSVFYELCDLLIMLYHMVIVKIKLNDIERQSGHQNQSKAQISYVKFSFYINKMKISNIRYREIGMC